MADRKADIFAGEGSIAGMLKKRRQAMEDYDPDPQPQAQMQDAPDLQPTTDDYRGYTKDKWGK